jgi:peptidoglycan/xylan/chitin deacetylase (PgdA/CDA1 family)
MLLCFSTIGSSLDYHYQILLYHFHHQYPCKMGKKVLVGHGVDVDAVSGWINTQIGLKADVTNISRGVFGATVGVDRLLKLFDKYNIKASWYVPGHSIESFPKQMAKVRDAGHEM